MKLIDLATPCLILDQGRLRTNVARMSDRARGLGVRLRPHMKTCKSAEVGRLAAGNGAITVSTLREAEYFAAHGFTEIFYAVGLVPAKVARIASLIHNGIDVSITLDDSDNAMRVAAVARGHHVSLPVMIEIDSDGHRNGTLPQGTALEQLAAMIEALDGMHLQGVMTHAGESYAAHSGSQLADHAELEREAVITAAATLRRAGFTVGVISVGSTPTAAFVRSLAGVDEMRPGVYMFGDLFQSGLGVCTQSDIAISVLTTVCHHNRRLNRLLIDAGALALSKDRSTARQSVDQGYGLVTDIGLNRFNPELIVVDVNQEHGIVSTRDGSRLPFESLPIGSVLRVLPNHACMTAAGHDLYHVVDGSEKAISVWDRCRGW